jgi:hypothetical protein
MCARQSSYGFLATAVVLFAGCSSPGPNDPPPLKREPLTFTVTPSSATIEEGQTLQLIVTVTDPEGARIIPTGLDWSTTDQNVARLVGPGLVQGQRVGTALIAASWEGLSDQAEVRVVARPACRPLPQSDQSAVPCPTP